MDTKKIIKLEDYLFSVRKREKHAAGMMADIMGVICGLKPAAMCNFDENELPNISLIELADHLKGLGLEVFFHNHLYYSGGKMKLAEHFYVSKKKEFAVELHEAFCGLWSSMDDTGQVVDRKKWEKNTREIGDLLGYPKTATADFIRDNSVGEEERQKRMARNRYYAHSAKHEEKEYRQYDLKLNKFIAEYAPKTAKLFANEKEKRWI